MAALRLFFLALVVALLAACRAETHADNASHASRAAALEISRKAATGSGYDLSKYKLDTFGRELSEDQREWLFGYICYPSPGCHFLVVVDRKTGKATVYPGE
jgi:hypothetical protein